MAWGKTSIKDATYETIKAKILHQEYRMGEPLNLTKLEKELGISNTPIREAISALVSEGLLVSFHNSRVHVVKFSKKDIKDLFDVVRLITESAFQLVLENDNVDELVGLLEDRLTEQRMIVVRNNDYYDLVKASDFFNRAFIEASHNIRMNTIYDRIANLLFLCNMHYLSSGDRDLQHHMEEHEGLIDAVRKKDPALLRERLIAHYDISKLYGEA